MQGTSELAGNYTSPLDPLLRWLAHSLAVSTTDSPPSLGLICSLSHAPPPPSPPSSARHNAATTLVLPPAHPRKGASPLQMGITVAHGQPFLRAHTSLPSPFGSR